MHHFQQENLQPFLQEAAQRHQTPPSLRNTSSLPTSNTLPTNSSGQDANKTHRYDFLVKKTYDKILKATELAKYEKKAQLIEKLKRNGHKTDLLAKKLPGKIHGKLGKTSVEWKFFVDFKSITPVVATQKVTESPPKKIITPTTKI